MKTTTEEIKKALDDFKITDSADGWTRFDGERLMMTPSKYCVKESLTGKLMRPEPQWYIVGRDEIRRRSELRRLAKNMSDNFFLAVLVEKSLVIGKEKTIKTVHESRRNCQIKWTGKHFEKPSFLFVSYQTESGKTKFRRIQK